MSTAGLYHQVFMSAQNNSACTWWSAKPGGRTTNGDEVSWRFVLIVVRFAKCGDEGC
jgi:hypothetical protein